MKRITLTIIAALTISAGAIAQNVDDALRYSQIFYNGTARFISMGGAFTALGGDLSSLSQNPAGLGVYRSSEISFSPQLFHINTSALFNSKNTDYLYNFNLGQAGIALNLINNTNQSGLITLNAGYSFNRTNNFNSSIRIEGRNNNSSMADYWADQSFGIHYTNLGGAAGIAYDAWVIDTLTWSGGTEYGTVFSNYGDNPPSVYGQNVRRLISNEGYTGEHAFSIGGNYSNMLFFGATLGISSLNFTSHYEHNESVNFPMASGISNFTYTDHYENKATGYTFKLGAIVKPVEYLRIGLAFHSPTIYRVNEYYYDNITSNFDDGDNYNFSNEPMRYSYALTTPFRAMAGVAVQIKKLGMLSADYEFIDYGSARFSQTGDNYDYSQKNLDIKNELKSAGNLRLGGELRLNKFYLRTGFGYHGKAFKQGRDNEDLDHVSFSAGGGFRESNIFIDLGFTSISNNQKYFLYPVGAGVVPAQADLTTTRNIFALTFGYKFGY